jgi:hypothetical protein
MPVEPITHLSSADRAVALAALPAAEARRSESPAAASAAGAVLRQPPSAADDLALVRTADNALGEIHALLHRVRVLAMRSLSGSVTPDARAALQAEADELARELAGRVGTAASNGRCAAHRRRAGPARRRQGRGQSWAARCPTCDRWSPPVRSCSTARRRRSGRRRRPVVAVARDREAVGALRDQLERVVTARGGPRPA